MSVPPVDFKPVSSGDGSAKPPGSPRPGRPIPPVPPRGDASRPLVAGRISKGPSGLWGKVARFFNRHFARITDDEKKEAHEIKELAAKVETTLAEADAASTKAKKAQESLPSRYPTAASIQHEKVFQATIAPLLEKAKEELDALKQEQHVKKAEELAEKHAVFDSLTDSIRNLTKRVDKLEGRVTVGEGLCEMEEALEKYQRDKSWAQFDQINIKKRELCAILKNLITDNEAFKNDSFLKNYAVKPDLSTTDAYRVIGHMYPDLKGHIERLCDVYLENRDKRIENLNANTTALLPLFSKYKQLSDKINDLEESLHDKSILSRIYRLFHGTDSLSAKLKQAREDQESTYQQILDVGSFNPEELKSLQESAKLNSDIESLVYYMDRINRSFVYLELREPISNNLSDLIHQFAVYEAVKGTHKSTAKASQDEAQKAVDIVKGQILVTFERMGQHMAEIKKIRKDALPPNFDTLEPLAQMSLLIRTATTTLDIKTKLVIAFIERLDGSEKDAVIQAIKRGETSPKPMVAMGSTSVVAIAAPPAGAPSSIHAVLGGAPLDDDAAPEDTAAASDKVPVSVVGAPPPPPPPPPLKKITAAPVGAAASGATKTSLIQGVPGTAAAPAELMTQVQAGASLRHVDEKEKHTFVPTTTAHLQAIQEGIDLRDTSKIERTTIRNYSELQKSVAAGTIKVKDITEEEMRPLTDAQKLDLSFREKMAGRSTAMDSNKADAADDDSDWE